MLDENLFHAINQFSRHFYKALNEILVPLGLYSGQWSIIYCLYTKGSSTQSELATYLGVEPPSMTRALLRLEKAGFIVKETGQDKREKHICLTHTAKALYPQWQATIAEFEKKVLLNVTDSEKEMILQSIQKMSSTI